VSGFWSDKFWSDGFWSNGFWDLLGGGISHHKSKRAYLERDGKILVFANASRAAAWVASEKSLERPEVIQGTKVAPKVQNAPVAPLRQPEAVIQIDMLALLLDQFGIKSDLTQLIALNEYAAMFELYRRVMEMRDEEEIELLLLYA
jgi:hypothetical protein